MSEGEPRQSDDPTDGQNPLKSDRLGLEARLSNAEAELSDRYRELANLTNLLRQQERQNERSIDHIRWLSEVCLHFRKLPRWWSLMPRSWRLRRERRRLTSSGLFEPDRYLERYPDVGTDGQDPHDHFLRHGIHEGRAR